MPLIMLVNEQIEKTRTALTKVASRVVKRQIGVMSNRNHKRASSELLEVIK